MLKYNVVVIKTTPVFKKQNEMVKSVKVYFNIKLLIGHQRGCRTV